MSAGSIGIPSKVVRAQPFVRTRPRLPIIESFVLFEFACQVALLIASIGSARVLVRCGAFGVSLALLLIFPPGKRIHPAVKPMTVAMVLLGLAIFNP